MTSIDWHADRGGVALLDRAPKSESLDLHALRHYRRRRVRDAMAKHNVAAVIVGDPVNIR